jgi:hypothetical protein
MSSLYKIEKNIPVQVKRESNKYPFSKMEVGDSFFVKSENGQTPSKTRAAIMQCIARFYLSNTDVKFKTSVLDNGVRVWKTK